MLEQDQDKLSSRLRPNEKVLWTGRPKQGFAFTRLDWFQIPASVVIMAPLLAISCGLVGGAFRDYQEYVDQRQLAFVLLAIPLIFVSFYLLVGRFIHDRINRAHMIYALTNEAAHIVPMWGLLPKRLDLNRYDMRLEQFIDGQGTIQFVPSSGRPQWFGYPFGGRVGATIGQPPRFYRIENASVVFEQAKALSRDRKEALSS